ncbi:hypothetical protein SUGI_0897300 [Cryptomeria japonica]|uniref:agglutinin-like n=1 Tax=Cryptomeria japonica TaxID=3369 RepID=UPI0024146921|nr:agglutinin-like [Cryptomeria japonica]XP_059067311.1 agglutinin-like [Cryptomeria japonica]XP_059067312.1 agglutinin-like [Cryptomeria japonica]XP_059067313.1 agglutinin-like [Cryptomeria japonica]GLJ43219.1 hypothetical protein SUGI_0897300 [Cryptomeria japonica]
MANSWGSEVGCKWDDGKYYKIKSITVYYGDILHGFEVDYIQRDARNKVTNIQILHGKKTGQNSKIFLGSGYAPVSGSSVSVLAERDLKKVEGYMSHFHGHKIITSLTFITNDGQRHGPYGSEIGVETFNSAANKKIVGFHGYDGTYLNKLGVHYQ